MLFTASASTPLSSLSSSLGTGEVPKSVRERREMRTAREETELNERERWTRRVGKDEQVRALEGEGEGMKRDVIASGRDIDITERRRMVKESWRK